MFWSLNVIKNSTILRVNIDNLKLKFIEQQILVLLCGTIDLIIFWFGNFSEILCVVSQRSNSYGLSKRYTEGSHPTMTNLSRVFVWLKEKRKERNRPRYFLCVCVCVCLYDAYYLEVKMFRQMKYQSLSNFRMTWYVYWTTDILTDIFHMECCLFAFALYSYMFFFIRFATFAYAFSVFFCCCLGMCFELVRKSSNFN